MSLTACRNHLIRASVEAQRAGFSSLAQVLVVTAQQVNRACPETETPGTGLQPGGGESSRPPHACGPFMQLDCGPAQGLMRMEAEA